jgi:hypothetical protein
MDKTHYFSTDLNEEIKASQNGNKKPSLKLIKLGNKTKCFYLSALTDSSIKSLASISA